MSVRRRRRSGERLFARLRRLFLSGLGALVPVVATVYVLYLLFTWTDNLLRGILFGFLPWHLPGLGILGTLLVVLLSGAVVTNLVGRQLVAWADALLRRVPLASTLYSTFAQLVEALVGGRAGYQRVVAVEYPRRGLWSLGFVTRDPGGLGGRWPGPRAEAGRAADAGEADGEAAVPLLNVFIPTTPNPASGSWLMVPRDEVVFVDLSVEEAMRVIVSAGMVVPERRPAEGAAAPAAPARRPGRERP
ncbi:MAG: DUF502 domain-containing protein [Clostridia bacterium]|nr:DUF502 domain-containing protein [Clostridia bacterium]MCL6522176.1 DUF502 domain-containing protein [Bacillota bacterium]